MSNRKVLSQTRKYLLRLTEFNTDGEYSLGENLNDAIQEAYEILAVPPLEIDSGDWITLENLNDAFDFWLRYR